MRPVASSILLFILAALLPAQQQNASSKTRPGDNSNAQGNVLGIKPEAVLDVVKLKGVLSKIDLAKRTITVSTGKEEDPLELAFPQPAGREQIKVSKKVAREIGKKKLRLEELEVGSKINVQYYSALGQVMELVVEETGRG